MKVTNLRQSGIQDILGEGPRTISQAGCMLTCFAMASNALNGTRFTVSQANDILRAANAFYGSGLDTSVATQRLALKRRRTKIDIPSIFDAIEDGHALVMIGVDYKPGRSSGFSDADHFVLAHSAGKDAKDKPVLFAADPATGTDVVFHLHDVVGGKRLVAQPSPRVTWRAAEAMFLTSEQA